MEYKGFEIATRARKPAATAGWVAAYTIYKLGAVVHHDWLTGPFNSFDDAHRAAEAAARRWTDTEASEQGH